MQSRSTNIINLDARRAEFARRIAKRSNRLGECGQLITFPWIVVWKHPNRAKALHFYRLYRQAQEPTFRCE